MSDGHAGLCHCCSHTPKTGFLASRPIYVYIYIFEHDTYHTCKDVLYVSYNYICDRMLINLKKINTLALSQMNLSWSVSVIYTYMYRVVISFLSKEMIRTHVPIKNQARIRNTIKNYT